MPQDKRAVQYHPTASCMKSNISRMKKQLHDYSRETCLRVKPENQAIKQRMEFSEFSHFWPSVFRWVAWNSVSTHQLNLRLHRQYLRRPCQIDHEICTMEIQKIDDSSVITIYHNWYHDSSWFIIQFRINSCWLISYQSVNQQAIAGCSRMQRDAGSC
jgi:hypothetical protein